MPASSMYRRPLGRSSAHRQALLRNLVTSLITHESISTTYAKAKEVQPVIEKLITLGKKDTSSGYEKAKAMLFQPEKHLSKVFGELKERYSSRPGGYTRVLRCEPLKNDMAASAIICLVDGPRDVRFNMTARALLRQQEENLQMNDVTATNVRKVTRFRENGIEDLAEEVKMLEISKNKRENYEKKLNEKRGARFMFTNELPKKDFRYRKDAGPGRLFKRKLWKWEFEETESGIPSKRPEGKGSHRNRNR